MRTFVPFRILENGAKYEGEWNPITNIKEGEGTQIWPDGSRYDGEWFNDKANGQG